MEVSIFFIIISIILFGHVLDLVKSFAYTKDTFPVFNFRSDGDRVNDFIICRLKSVMIGQVDLKKK